MKPWTAPDVTLTASLALAGRWNLRIYYPQCIGTVDCNLTTPAMIDEIAGLPAEWPIRVAVEDLTSPIGRLPSGGYLYETLSLTRDCAVTR